jgi:hypothetical protein
MHIELVYSKSDPRQTQACDLVVQYINEHGILASITMYEAPVDHPQVVIDGERFEEQRRLARKGDSELYPTLELIERVIEERLWGM